MQSGRTTPWRRGLRLGVGLGASTFALAVSFGALAAGQGWSPAQAIAFSAFGFAGSAQFAALTSLAGGGGALAAILAAALMNLRFLPMGVAAAASFRGSRLRRIAEAQSVVDASWVAAHEPGGRFDRELMIAATLMQYPCWVAGTAVGAVLAPSTEFIEKWGLDVVLPAFFVILLVDTLRDDPGQWRVTLLAALLAGGVVLVAPTGTALIASAGAALLGLVTRRSRGRSS